MEECWRLQVSVGVIATYSNQWDLECQFLAPWDWNPLLFMPCYLTVCKQNKILLKSFVFSQLTLMKIRVSKVSICCPPPRLPTCKCCQWQTVNSYLYNSHEPITEICCQYLSSLLSAATASVCLPVFFPWPAYDFHSSTSPWHLTLWQGLVFQSYQPLLSIIKVWSQPSYILPFPQ